MARNGFEPTTDSHCGADQSSVDPCDLPSLAAIATVIESEGVELLGIVQEMRRLAWWCPTWLGRLLGPLAPWRMVYRHEWTRPTLAAAPSPDIAATASATPPDQTAP